MKGKIHDFVWNRDKGFYWVFNDKKYEKQFKNVPQSVIRLNDKSGFAVVGSYEEFGRSNAFIFNADGSIRFLPDMPPTIKNPICFHEIYYIKKELTAIIAAHNFDYACVVDEKTGVYKKIYETR